MLQSASGEQHGEVAVTVDRSVAHTTTKHDQRVVKNLCFLQSRNKITQLGGQKCFYDLELTDAIC